jgi:hypothetical protein
VLFASTRSALASLTALAALTAIAALPATASAGAWSITNKGAKAVVTGSVKFDGEKASARVRSASFRGGCKLRLTKTGGDVTCQVPRARFQAGSKIRVETSYLPGAMYKTILSPPLTVKGTYRGAPSLKLTGKPDAERINAETFVFLFDANGATAVMCRLDGGKWSDCWGGFSLVNFEFGDHTFGVQATGGGKTTMVSHSFTAAADGEEPTGGADW